MRKKKYGRNSLLLLAALLVGRSRDQFRVVSLGIFFVVPSDKTMCPEVDSASENEYQGFLLGKRRSVRLADDLPPL